MTALVKPTAGASKELKNFGLTSQDVATELSQKGLQVTLQTITDAVGKKFPAGSAQYLQAVATIVGGTRGLNTTLELTGSHMATYKANIAAVTDAVRKGGNTVQGWDEVQGDFNFQMQRAKTGAEAFGISVGQPLLPYATQLLQIFVANVPAMMSFGNQAVTVGIQVGTALAPGFRLAANALGWIRQNGDLVKATLAGLAGAFAAFKIAQFISTAMMAVNAFRAMAMAEGILSAVNTVLGISELFALWPLLLIALAIGVVIAITVLLITHWKQVTQVAGGFGRAVAGAWSVAWGATSSFGGRIIGIIGSFFSHLGSMASRGWQEFSSRPLYWIAFLLAFIPMKLSELEGQALMWLLHLVGDAAVWADQMEQKGARAAVGFVQAVLNELPKLPGQAWTLLTNVVLAVGRWELSLLAKGREAAQGFGRALLDEWNALPGQMIAIGQAIVQGVISGIKSQISQATGVVGSFVSGLVAGAKAAAGAHSPSRLSQEEVGAPLAQGVALGIRTDRSAQMAMQALLASLIPSRSTAVAAGQGAAPDFGGLASTIAAGGAGGQDDRLLTAVNRLCEEVTQELRVLTDIRGLMQRGATFSTAAYGR
jgi:hypothetical protein